jgi:EAL domain-containing protein (putative c-di-GMP-specific phosphodiesterase class I)
MSLLSRRGQPTTPAPTLPPGADTEARHLGEDLSIEDIVAGTLVQSVYQPIVELDTGVTVGYEALARGPRGSTLERPDLMFAAARRAGCLSALDQVCQQAALNGARASGMEAPWTLFVNIEPETAHSAFLAPVRISDDENRAAAHALEGLRIVVELTERALIADPTQLLLLVGRIRARGWGIALDDVGADRDSLALLPLLRPDVIKLDLRLVQQQPTGEIAQIVSAVNAEAERSGTVILAEGIETPEHAGIALSMGASLGQGWLLGRPVPLPPALPAFAGSPIVIVERGDPASDQSPFAMATELRPARSARKQLLIEMSKHLERQALSAGESAVVLATFQNASFFTPATRRRYERLLAQTAFVGVLGEGMPPEPLPGIRGCLLTPDDPLVQEWDIVVVGPHFTATLVARDLHDSGPDTDRRFDFILSHDRDLAIRIALAMMARVWPSQWATGQPPPDMQTGDRSTYQ